MITIKDFMQAVNYRITEGSEYMWECYGPNAYSLDSWDGDFDGSSTGIVFDTKTQVVYEMSSHDYINKRSYRWINPGYVQAHAAEVKSRGIDDAAYDDVKHIELEAAEDMLEKAAAIVAGKEYDERIQVPIELDERTMLALMKDAHEQDITFNEYVCNLLKAKISQIKDGA